MLNPVVYRVTTGLYRVKDKIGISSQDLNSALRNASIQPRIFPTPPQRNKDENTKKNYNFTSSFHIRIKNAFSR
jgi:hypothetical protein